MVLMQDYYFKDLMNFHKYGLKYTLQQIKKDYTCQTYSKYYMSSEQFMNCVKLHKC